MWVPARSGSDPLGRRSRPGASEHHCERGDEGLTDRWVAVRGLKCALVAIRVLARDMICARPTRRRKCRASVPRLARERRVQFNVPAPEDDRQKAVNVCEAGIGNSIGNLSSVEFVRAVAIELIDAMDDSWVGLGEAVDEDLGQEKVLR
jgi:hypothetical protein